MKETNQQILFVVCGIAFFHLGAVGVLAGSIPFHVFQIVRDIPLRDSFALSLQGVAVSLGQAIGSVMLGYFSDRFGRKRLLLISAILESIGTIMLSFNVNFAFFLFCRFCNGMFVGTIPILIAAASDLTVSVADRTKIVSLVRAFLDLGMVAGSGVGEIYSSENSFSILVYISAGFSLVNVLIIFFLYGGQNGSLSQMHFHSDHRTYKSLDNATDDKSENSNINGEADIEMQSGSCIMKSFSRLPLQLSMAYVGYFLLVVGYSVQQTLFSELARDRCGIHAKRHYWAYLAVGITMFLTEAGGIRAMTRFLKLKHMVTIGGIITATCLSLLAIMPNYETMIIVLCVLAAGYALFTVSVESIISLLGLQSSKGLGLGCGESFASCARIAGPILSGILYSKEYTYIPFGTGSVIVLVGSIILWRAASSELV